MKRSKELELSERVARKKYTEAQLLLRKFCVGCLDYKGKKMFGYDGTQDDGRSKRCKTCQRKVRKKGELRNKLLATEIFVEGADKPVIDKVIAGRNLVSRMSLAAFLGVSERTILRMNKRKEIQGYNFLGQLYFKKEDIEKWLEEKLGEKIELENKYISNPD